MHVPNPDLQIQLTRYRITAIQQTANGAFIKEFPHHDAGIDALLKWSCDILENGSSILILTGRDRYRSTAELLTNRLQRLRCGSGGTRHFTIHTSM